MKSGNHFPIRFTNILLMLMLAVLAIGCAPDTSEVSGTAYYVDCAAGDDLNPGTSASRPWRTLDRVNAAVLAPGDGVFFRRGSTCLGTLQPKGSGEEGRPMTIGAYGQGERPIIAGGQNASVLLLRDQSYWHIQDLDITGGTLFGIHITGSAGAGTLTHFRLTNLVVHEVQGGELTNKVSGLVVFSSGGENNTLDDVIIDQVTAYNTNQWGGIIVAGLSGDFRLDPPNLSTRITIRNSTVYNVYGDGIVLWGVEDGLIETSVAYDTGQQPAPQTIGTPNSIWTWMCRNCTVQFNESYRAASPDVDGGCYDVDWGSQDNLYQYNYGHDSDGYCMAVFGASGLTTSNSIIRYNVCANNGQRADLALRQGDVYFSTWTNGLINGVEVFNNTFYWNPVRNAPLFINHSAFTGDLPRIFANNIIYSTVPWLIDTEANIELDHNLYWYVSDPSKPPVWLYGKEGIYTDFTDYQRSGQDLLGLFTDPMLILPKTLIPGRPTKTFILQPGSPAIDAGADLGDMGAQDFFGNPIPSGAGYDIGAYEWLGNNSSWVPAAVPDLTLTAALGGEMNLSSLAGKPTLVSFLDPRTEAAYNQLVVLRSIARQYDLKILVIVPEDSLDPDELANFAYDWQEDAIRVLVEANAAARRFGAGTQTTILVGNGIMVNSWDGWASPYALAIAVQDHLGLPVLASK